MFKTKSFVAMLGVSLFLAAGVLIPRASADQAYTVTLDTSVLQTSTIPSGDGWYLDYQLAGYDLPSENSATLSNFNFGTGGSHGADQILSGNVAGSIASYSLTDPSDYTISNVSELLIGFTPGNLLTYNLSFTSLFSGSASGFPDTLSFAVLYCDPAITACQSIVSSGLNASLAANLDGSGDTPGTFAADGLYNSITPQLSTPTTGGGGGGSTGVPEPGTLTLLLGGLVFGLIAHWLVRS
jgi:hypothetical protein